MKITDTIAAISSAAGNSGIGIIRVSGDEAIEIVDKIFKSNKKDKKLCDVDTHTVHYGHIVDGDKTGLAPNYEDADVKVILEDLRACVYNYYTELSEAVGTDARQAVITKHLGDALPKFSVTIKAVAN